MPGDGVAHLGGRGRASEVAGQRPVPAGGLQRLHDAPRLHQILAAIGTELWSSGTRAIGPLPILVACVALVGVARPISRAAVIALAAILVVLAADIVVYDNTPYDLTWQLQTSADRVVMQLFPALIWIGLRLARLVGASR